MGRRGSRERGWAEFFNAGEGALRKATFSQLLNAPREAFPEEDFVSRAGTLTEEKDVLFGHFSARHFAESREFGGCVKRH